MLKKIIRSYLALGCVTLYPVLIFLLFLLNTTNNLITLTLEVGSLVLFSIIFLILIAITNKIKLLFILFYWFLSLVIFIRISFIIRFNTSINASAFFIFFKTNRLEATGFLATYFSFKTYLVIILLCIPYFFKDKLNLISFENIKFSLNSKFVLFAISIFCAFLLNLKFYRQDFFINSYNSYVEYKKFKQNKTNLLSSNLNDNIEIKCYPEEEQTHVIIIGESLSNWHMQLYNYYRKTNPKLSEIKDELLIFKEIISPHTHTQASINKIFTLSDHKNRRHKNNSSIIQLANEGGYKTFWLSNQSPIGIHETLPTIISNAADYSKFVATDNQLYSNYDEKLLPLLDKVLEDKSKLKTIFIHLMGNHMRYHLRYPNEFNIFTEGNKHVGHSQNIINHYDNSVLYNDFIIRSIIQKINSKNIESSVTYFSDHGEDVYDIIDTYGHNEYEGTKPMYEIPLIFWNSNKESFENQEIIERKYNLEDFYHTFSSIIGVYSSDYSSKKDIFSPDFEEKKRYVNESDLYETK